MTIWAIFSFIGGVGLFLLGMKLMTEGLKVAAGDALRHILAWATHSRLRGVASGALITGLVQSSSAVIFATIGFVNAGVLGLGPAVSVIYGANLGTTMTTWLVSVAGLQFSLKAFALPFIGLGMLLQVMGRRATLQALGTALAGFGLFFLGLDVLTGLFADAGELVAPVPPESGVLTLALYCLIGVIMTVMMQSSSAALAVILTAAAGGLVGLPAAAAMMVGANIGTTSTAAFAAIGATPNARRVAASHVLFNLVEAVAVFLLFGLLLWWVQLLSGFPDAGGSVAVALAIFHTSGKLIGLTLMWPLTPFLVRWLERQFAPEGRSLAHAEYLDKTALETPSVGLQAVRQELNRVEDGTTALLRAALQSPPPEGLQLSRQQGDLRALLDTINEAIQGFSSHDLPGDLAAQLPELLRITHDLEEMGERALELHTLARRLPALSPPEAAQVEPGQRLSALALAAVADVGRQAQQASADPNHESLPSVDAFEARYQTVKQQLLAAGAARQLPSRQMGDWLDYYSNLRRIVLLAARIGMHLDTWPKE
ncbi:Na/Pi cotransporter family protein [Natronospirillum operosum]|uniref:Na/Pi cotransporter family protein n=1 Tax=Natronospirillum operosum TaxID=2759953 RepID=A0A4Z0WGW1_9GAMM|nr:Na/Pi symporter [Natronospirillum operosum]TGG94941.1 Na/Pi cotransporter family protein [Natronospirillum operosum]